MTVEQWKEFLQRWSDEWLLRNKSFSSSIRKSRWLGSRPATEKQISQLEKRLGYQMPTSYRNFLLTTNGWLCTSDFVERIRPLAIVEWLQTDNPQLLDAFSAEDVNEPMAGLSSEEYFSYDGRPFFDASHLRECLIIADPVSGDSMIYLLNPLVVSEDGEWEAWRFAHWIPGAERFPSFELMMRAEHESFLSAEGIAVEQTMGPYSGVYAPDQPRRKATAIGRDKAMPPRLTIPQLIDQLESPDRKMRLAAAKQLFRESRPHDPADEHPELNEPLGRILCSKLEAEVRCAAAAMLGSYGNTDSIPLLIAALNDPAVTANAISSLFYQSISMHDPRIGDAMVRLMETPRDYFVVDHAIYILEELKDARVAAIGMHLLDHAEDIPLNIAPTADQLQALVYQRTFMRMKGAFAFAHFAEAATEHLVQRLTNSNPEIRAAATAALREDPNKTRHLEKDLKPLLHDPDPAVRQQAEMTIRSLVPLPKVKISPKRMAEVQSQAEVFLRKAVSRKKNRF